MKPINIDTESPLMYGFQVVRRDMEILKDFRFWAFIITCLNFLGVIIVGCFNFYSHHKIVGNDLHHLALDLKEIKTKQDVQGVKLDDVIKDFSILSGRCEVRHSEK